jgi:pimeloyl-ACP methyl ester carboxylesterase
MTPQSRVIRTPDGIGLHCSERGDGAQAVLFIHGWSCDRTMWDALDLGALGDVRCVAVDLAGHGASVASVAARRWSIAGFGADVATIVEALGVDDVILVGHSMGGPVALEAALRLGARCRAIIGVDTFNEATFYRGRPAREIAERLAPFAADFRGSMRSMVAHITAPGCDPALVAQIGETMNRIDPAVALAVLDALLTWDIDARWPLLDRAVETINSAFLARRNETIVLDRLVVHELEGVGHFPMLEDPAAFSAALGAIIARAASG